MISGSVQAYHYRERATILSKVSIFTVHRYTRNVNSLNANCNAAHLCDYLFRDLPSCSTTTSCPTCNTDNYRILPFISVNVNTILVRGFSAIQDAISDNTINNTVRCGICKMSAATSTMEHGPHLLIDTSVITDDTYIESLHITPPTSTLVSITKIVHIGQSTYILSGVVFYCRKSQHYVAATYAGAV